MSLKGHAVFNCGLHCIIAEPYVTIKDLDDTSKYPFLILACDGVWDVFSDQEAAELILERYSVEGPFAGAAQLLVCVMGGFPLCCVM